MDKRILPILFAALTIALVSGCGSGNDDEASAADKAAFIARADTICKKADKRQVDGVESARAAGVQDSPNAREKLVTLVGLPPMQKEAEELSELEAPSGDEDEVEAVVKAIEAAVEEGEENPKSVLKQPGSNPFAEGEELAREYGFKVCAEL